MRWSDGSHFDPTTCPWFTNLRSLGDTTTTVEDRTERAAQQGHDDQTPLRNRRDGFAGDVVTALTLVPVATAIVGRYAVRAVAVKVAAGAQRGIGALGRTRREATADVRTGLRSTELATVAYRVAVVLDAVGPNAKSAADAVTERIEDGEAEAAASTTSLVYKLTQSWRHDDDRRGSYRACSPARS